MCAGRVPLPTNSLQTVFVNPRMRYLMCNCRTWDVQKHEPFQNLRETRHDYVGMGTINPITAIQTGLCLIDSSLHCRIARECGRRIQNNKGDCP
eukprot:4468154-Pyramimonas_sp.AAC.1